MLTPGKRISRANQRRREVMGRWVGKPKYKRMFENIARLNHDFVVPYVASVEQAEPAPGTSRRSGQDAPGRDAGSAA